MIDVRCQMLWSHGLASVAIVAATFCSLTCAASQWAPRCLFVAAAAVIAAGLLPHGRDALHGNARAVTALAALGASNAALLVYGSWFGEAVRFAAAVPDALVDMPPAYIIAPWSVQVLLKAALIAAVCRRAGRRRFELFVYIPALLLCAAPFVARSAAWYPLYVMGGGMFGVGASVCAVAASGDRSHACVRALYLMIVQLAVMAILGMFGDSFGVMFTPMSGDSTVFTPLSIVLVVLGAFSVRVMRLLQAERPGGIDSSVLASCKTLMRCLSEYKLGQRERHVAYAMIRGATNAQIAEALGISPGTVSTYRHRVFAKCGVSTAQELYACMMGRMINGGGEPRAGHVRTLLGSRHERLGAMGGFVLLGALCLLLLVRTQWMPGVPLVAIGAVGYSLLYASRPYVRMSNTALICIGSCCMAVFAVNVVFSIDGWSAWWWAVCVMCGVVLRSMLILVEAAWIPAWTQPVVLMPVLCALRAHDACASSRFVSWCLTVAEDVVAVGTKPCGWLCERRVRRLEGFALERCACLAICLVGSAWLAYGGVVAPSLVLASLPALTEAAFALLLLACSWWLASSLVDSAVVRSDVVSMWLRLCGLTEAETRAAALLSCGLSTGEAARRLVLSSHTLASQRRSVYRKFNIHAQRELIDVRYAVLLWWRRWEGVLPRVSMRRIPAQYRNERCSGVDS